tara:strand:- start:320 stop:493 length:174 start_codon:yes stop_codon:yes gene_type:complete
MKVKELINELNKVPKDLPIRADNLYSGDNEWVVDLEYSTKGESGYELSGEVRLITSI